MHLITISENAKKILPKFKQLKDFYLSGGTSLALQIGHRVSDDLDWFTEKSLPRNLYGTLQKVFRGETGQVEVRTDIRHLRGKNDIFAISFSFC